ncbi:hypothetical protein [Bacteroides acidifaciens]|jgi:hypothetical protein|uniref:Uncharacterized protein n=2 Tax=Bacteroidales TaxID=171549 RepID=A0A7K3ME27_9BACE|nr:hypothetical protein [Bacteroides acidifaciens]MBF0731777.1 hypothetical protein [Bacteroides acidifaciens]MBF0834466.1 hypothetical protein [Bacteroides acidifaciens]NDO52637.1 hypothetical protein [Bacteroides acidifaciens]TFU44964.1 hypothetical protein E4T97_20395 [Bacteroides acidifaciens]
MMNTKPPDQPRDTTPLSKWMMDTMTIVIYLLNSIANSMIKLVKKSDKPQLSYKGSTIIMLEDLAIGLNKTTRTIRKMRAEGKMEYYISNDGRTIFMTQDQFDNYVLQNFVNVTRDNYRAASPA